MYIVVDVAVPVLSGDFSLYGVRATHFKDTFSYAFGQVVLTLMALLVGYYI